MASEQLVLLEFFRRIWREEKGYAYIALKDPNLPKDDPRFWQRKYFEWPADEISIVQSVLANRASHDVYFAPSLFRERSSKKEAVLGSFCYWVEFDGSLPVEFNELPNPSMIVQTSSETHQHIYWCVDQLIPTDRLEAVNRALTYELGADASGWDANQVLRPPETLNHKKQAQAVLVHNDERFISSVAFSEIRDKNLPPKLDISGALPEVSDVIRKYEFTRKVWDLFTQGVTHDRSAGLMSLGYHLAEMNLTNTEMLALLLHADNRWGKFAKRTDQYERLTEIVVRARQKYPYRVDTDKDEPTIISMGFRSLRAIERQITWLWDQIWYESGYFLLTGPSGVGKSQFSLDLGAHLVLGKEFLGRSVATKKVGFLSLEMNDIELKGILDSQAAVYTEEELNILEKNFRFFPRGYPLYVNHDENKEIVEDWIQREGLEVIIFDSLGSMTQELSKESDAKNLMDWNDRIRNNLGVSPLIIHHHRKAQVGNKYAKETSDIYGSYAITARATTTLTLWDIKRKGQIEVLFRKTRMSALPKPWAIQRQDNLTFKLLDDKIIIEEDEVIYQEEEVQTTEWNEWDI